MTTNGSATATVELIRIPSERYQRQQEPGALYLQRLRRRFDYKTLDGRWLVQESCGGLSVTDTTGQYVCGSCTFNTEGHATIVRTLAAAKAFIAEWSA